MFSRLLNIFKSGFTQNQSINDHFINSTILDYSYISIDSIVHNTDIGKFTSIGPQCTIGFGEHPTNTLSTSPAFYENIFEGKLQNQEFEFTGKQRVTIGNDVWIGAQVFIRNGVTIGDGAIIGASSTVLSDVPAFTISVGTPAKQIRMRYSDSTIDILMKIKWWNWDETKIKTHKHLFIIDNEAQLLAEIQKINFKE